MSLILRLRLVPPAELRTPYRGRCGCAGQSPVSIVMGVYLRTKVRNHSLCFDLTLANYDAGSSSTKGRAYTSLQDISRFLGTVIQRAEATSYPLAAKYNNKCTPEDAARGLSCRLSKCRGMPYPKSYMNPGKTRHPWGYSVIVLSNPHAYSVQRLRTGSRRRDPCIDIEILISYSKSSTSR